MKRDSQQGALVLRRRTSSEHSNTYVPCDTDGCRVTSGGTGGTITRSVAFFEAIIIDRHAANLCRGCASRWRSDWDRFADMTVMPAPLKDAA